MPERRVLQSQIRDVDCVVYNIGQLATVAADAPDGVGVVTQAALAAQGGRIVWIGPSSDLRRLRVTPAADATLIDAQRRLVTPGFVDSHTHLVHAGRRGLSSINACGIDYASQLAESAQTGERPLRGILKTVHDTRAANEFELAASAQRRLRSAVSLARRRSRSRRDMD